MGEIFGGVHASHEDDPWSLPSPKHDWDANERDSVGPVATTGETISSGNALSGSVWDEPGPVGEPVGVPLAASAVLGEEHGLGHREEGLQGDDGDNQDSEHSPSDFLNWCNDIRKQFTPMSRDIILVEEIPEKEGLLFKHINYLVTHLIALPNTDANNDRKVIRRYSDFVWLFETLLKKYPFRIIPDLPPKKINYAASNDVFFLERRKRGLKRFINQIMRHPVLSRDTLVLMFLTVPTDLTGWRRNANYDSTEEFNDKKISSFFLKRVWNNEAFDMFTTAEDHIRQSLEKWSKLTILIERFEKRSILLSQDEIKFNSILNEFTNLTTDVYSIETSNIAEINEGLRQVTKHISNSVQLKDEENKVIQDEILQEFKNYQDFLVSITAMFERFKSKGGNQIPLLTKKLEINELKLQELNKKPDVKGFEVDKLNQLVKTTSLEIKSQINRDWLIKETVLFEFVLFQETQFQITKIFQNWISNKLKYSELSSNNWGKLLTILQDVPISRSD